MHMVFHIIMLSKAGVTWRARSPGDRPHTFPLPVQFTTPVSTSSYRESELCVTRRVSCVWYHGI